MKNYSAYLILFLKEAKEPLSLNELMDLLEKKTGKRFNRKTISLMIKQINDFFMVLIGTPLIEIKKRTGCELVHPFFEDGSLRFLLDSLSTSKALSLEEYRTLRSRIETFTSKKQIERIGHIDAKKEDREPLFNKLNTLIKAIDQQKSVMFQYYYYEIEDKPPYQLKKQLRKQGNYPNDPNHYLVSPYDILLANEHYYLLCFCDKHKEELTLFRLDRMDKILTTNKEFIDIRDMFDMKELPSKLVHMYTGTRSIHLKLRASSQALQEIIQRLGKDVKIKKEFDQFYYIEKEDVLYSEGLMGWLMMLSNQVEVIEPIRLKEDLISRLEKTLALYKGEKL